jgi:hypothetical protein
VERYVCLGDDVDPTMEPDNGQGRFADITKSAELYLSQQGLVWPMCVRDTPGVNDTFLVREQITVNAIRSSRVCVVVLSAHQALSTVDMALIRMIANIRARDVIIFVNRVDELGDPVREIPEIRDSIRETLQAQNGPANATILFGSAHWATHAIDGNWDDLGEASAQALVQMAEHEARGGLEDSNAVDVIWRLSGLPALGRAISERIIEGEGARHDRPCLPRGAQHRQRSGSLPCAGRRAGRGRRGAQDRTREADRRDRQRHARRRGRADGRARQVHRLSRKPPRQLAQDLPATGDGLAGQAPRGERRKQGLDLRSHGSARPAALGLPGVLGQGDPRHRGDLRAEDRDRAWKASSWAPSSFRAGPSGWSRPWCPTRRRR